MDYGRYFRLDADASIIDHGLAVFRYRPDGEKDSSLYVTITATTINFDVVSTKGNSRVLTIPLKQNLEGSLAATLAENFKHVVSFPEMITYSSSVPSDDDNRDFFAAFFDFGKGTKSTSPPWIYLKNNEKYDLPLAKLVLDFLFDLQETDVFRMSSHYEELIENLYNNFFFRSLAAKAAYLYHRGQYQIVTRNDQLEKRVGSARRERREFYGGLLFAAEKKWTECIRDPRSDKIFHNSGGWFGDSETEMKRVYWKWLPIRLDKEHQEAREENNENVSHWLVQRYASLSAWSLCFRHRSFFGPHMLLPRLVAAITAAWFTFALLVGNDMKLPEFIEKKESIRPAVLMMISLILLTSCIFIGKFAPFIGKTAIFLRALRLTVVSILISAMIALMLHFTLGAPSTWREFEFFCVAATYTGVIFQLFFSDKNPSAPI